MATFIKENKKVNIGKFNKDFTKQNLMELLKELTEKLNSCFGANKSILDWRKVPLINRILFEEQDDFEQFPNTTSNNISTILEVTEVECSANNITSPTPPENATDKHTSKQTFIGRKRKENSENLSQTIASIKEFFNLQQQEIELKREEIELKKQKFEFYKFIREKEFELNTRKVEALEAIGITNYLKK